MKLARTCTWVLAAGLALGAATVARAQDYPLLKGQERTYRWNDQRTGYGFDPGSNVGLPSNQMPAIQRIQQDTAGRDVQIPNPDLTWIFPMDREGEALDAEGNAYPQGYRLGEIHSSPTVASIDITDPPTLAVMFGSTTTVRRDIRNELPGPNGTIGRPGRYTDPSTGAYSISQDPYGYLHTQRTGAVFSLEAFSGTTEEFDGGPYARNYRPLWWYGVRSLPYYTDADEDITPTGAADGQTFKLSPSEAMSQFYLNASDTAMKAFDYSPTEDLSASNFLPIPATNSGADQRSRRKRLLAQYLAPAVGATQLKSSGKDSGPGIDTGAGPVGRDRPDIPERLTDRLYNLSIDGARFGLAANERFLAGSAGNGTPNNGPLNNRFRLPNGMGAVNSTGTFVRLPSTVSYTSESYDIQGDSTPAQVEALLNTRRDPANVKRASLSTQHLYVVGSDDGYVYAFDANPVNARRVPASGGGTLNYTYMGRLVWAFRAAVRAPLYVSGSGSDQTPLTVAKVATGEQAPVLGDGTTHVLSNNSSSALATDNAAIISGAILSSPVAAEITPANTAFNFAGEQRMVIFVGSAIGRMFCLDAATGQEIWEFKTTPKDYTILNKGGTFSWVDGVTGYPINTSPTLGYLPGATSVLNPSGAPGRLAVFFGADDGKVYALDAADGSPISGWDVSDQRRTGASRPDMATLAPGTRSMLDHYGFVTYAFEDKSQNLLSTTALDGKFGRRRSDLAKPVTASVVARPAGNGVGYAQSNGNIIPEVNLIFVSSTTNQQDAAVGDDPAATGGSIFGVDPNNGNVLWTFDRWRDVRRAANDDFDDDPRRDQTIRPGAFNVTPAYATGINMFNQAEADDGNDGSSQGNRLEDQNVLFAVDDSGRLFALQTDTANQASEARPYWLAPYDLPGNAGSSGGVYSTPVVSSPITEGDPNAEYAGRNYVFIGVTGGIVAVDTVAQRSSPVTGTDNEVLPGGGITGGEVTWGWETPRDSVVVDQNADPPTTIITADARPVVTTPAIYTGYVFAGADNGFLYAWGNQIDGFSFGNGGGIGGYPGFRNGGPRPPLPDVNRPSGGGRAPATGNFFVDIFQAGFTPRAYGETPFTTPSAVGNITPTGVLPGGDSTNPDGTVSPLPVGLQAPTFQEPNGGILEWGDPVAVVVWGEDLDRAVSDAGNSTDPDTVGTVTIQLTGPGINASYVANIEYENGHAYARQIFYLNPFNATVPASLRYPNAPGSQIANPLFGDNLPPNGGPISVEARFQRPRTTVTDPNGNSRRTPGTATSPRIKATTKFRLANPLNITGHFQAIRSVTPLVALTADPNVDREALRNGNERVPVQTSVIGDHGTPTKPDPGSIVQVLDRSNMARLRDLANSRAAGSGDDIYLRVRMDPAPLRWTGGPSAAYKPLLARTSLMPNGIPLPDPSIPPEPLYTNYWGPQIASIYDAGQTTAFMGAEQPPGRMGEENHSQDYPDMNASVEGWKALARPPYTSSEVDATVTDVPLVPSGTSAVQGPINDPAVRNIGAASLYLQAAVPKYQPANYAPSSVDPSRATGVGPGYYTINPKNSTAMQAAYLGWNPGNSSAAGPYWAFNSPEDNGGQTQQYAGPMGIILPATSTLAAQERNYLTKVYVDTNGNSNADTGAEPYRMFVAGVQVRPDERIQVTSATIDVPQGPENAVPGGFIPFQFYFDGQAVAAGAGQGDQDKFLYGERNLYAPFTVYNQGNVNLWNLRMDKYDPMASHLVAPGVDTNPYVGAEANSNWPASGVLKRTNLVSTLDALPQPSGRGSAQDSTLWTPAVKPRVGVSDEGQGQILQVKDVFAFTPGAGGLPTPARPHNATGVATPPGRPYLTVAVPPGTTPGRYSTQGGRFVLFEDSGPPYNNSVSPYNGVLDIDTRTGSPMETGVSSDAQVLVNVGETRLTDKVSRLAPNIPQADAGVAFAATYGGGAPNSQAELTRVWQTLAQDATPSAYRDPRTGDLVTFWSSNRVGSLTDNGFQTIPGLTAGNTVADRYHIFASAMTWSDPLNPPINTNADMGQFLTGVLARNPWGWQYQGGNRGSFFFPDFGSARWFGAPAADSWIPPANAVNAALGTPAGTVSPNALTYTSPAPLTDFHGTSFPPVVFWTGATGTGADARSAIFYAPVGVDRATGEVGANAEPQAVGVSAGQRTLDPFMPKFSPQPFLITVGGTLTGAGDQAPASWLQNEQVKALGVVWFGGAPGAWKLYVSTIETDETGTPTGDGLWHTEQLALPDGVSSAMYPSAYYHQDAERDPSRDRRGILEVAFTGYSRSARNPDIYVVRYQAASGPSNWTPETAKVGNWNMLSFNRKGGTPGSPENLADKPLEQLLRVEGEPRPIYRSHWAQWTGRGNNGVVIYWFKKPVSAPGNPGRLDDFQLYATFTSRSPGGDRNSNTREVSGRLASNGETVPGVSAFIDAGAGTVRFTTTDPANNPAPLSRPYNDDGVMVQDYIFAAMTPSALRVTVDDDILDTQPRIWLDQTHEAITDQRRTNVPVSPTNPLMLRRDRLWLLWRRSAQPEGATRASGLFYQTYRLGVDVGLPIGLDANGRPQVSIGSGNLPVEVDVDKGRIYFTGFDDGATVNVTLNGTNLGNYVVGWIPEDTAAPITMGTAGAFRLPMTHWPNPRAVPTSQQGNDSQPWLFKDPFSDLAPGTPEYYARGNNDMWLFWASTRPSRAIGAQRTSPTLGWNDPTLPDPYYFTDAGLMATSSASDVYYTTLSPDFAGR